MAESILNRPMFNRGARDPVYKKPSEMIEENQQIQIDFGEPRFQQPLGINDFLSKTQFELILTSIPNFRLGSILFIFSILY